MNILDTLEEMANTLSLEHEICGVIEKNQYVKIAFEKNNMNDIKKIFSSSGNYANEISVVRN